MCQCAHTITKHETESRYWSFAVWTEFKVSKDSVHLCSFSLIEIHSKPTIDRSKAYPTTCEISSGEWRNPNTLIEQHALAKYFVVWFLSTHTQYICTEHTHTKIICLAGVIINLLRNSQNTRMYIIILACLCSLKKLHVSISLSPILMQTATVYYKPIPTYWIRARDNSEYQTSKYTPNATAKSVSIKHRSQWSAVFLHRVFRCLSSF